MMPISAALATLALFAPGSRAQAGIDYKTIKVPPFVKSAKEISLSFEMDVGEAAKRFGTGDKKEIYCFFPVPYSNEYHVYWDVKGTIGGKDMGVMTDLRGNKVFYALANPDSGWGKVTWKGLLMQRVVRPEDKLATPIQLPPDELARYTHGKDYDLIRETDTKFNERMRAEGLVRGRTERPYDFMMRVATYMKAHFAYGPADAGINVSNEQLFDAKHLDCNPTAFFLAKVGIANGIPVRTMPGVTVDTFGVQRETYTTGLGIHNRMEFFDTERGWVPVDGSGAQTSGASAVGSDTPDWGFVPIQNGKLEFGIMKPDGHWDATLHAENRAGWSTVQSVSRGGNGRLSGSLPPEYGRSSFTSKPIALDRFARENHYAGAGKGGGN